ncbi:hypothetical protein, partial [Bartonella sp. CL9QHWL]|uniref:hypothetical protein n=1 Tax=Bartonella sp. CL9QHWL TaxID=3243542 RepID=UPI0035D02CAB
LKADRNATDEALLLCFQQGRNKMLQHYAKSNWLYCASLVLDPRHKTIEHVVDVDDFKLLSAISKRSKR